VWNVALSAADVAALNVPLCTANRATPPYPSNLLVHARFYEGGGTTTTNWGTLGGTGTLTSPSWQTQTPTCA
jgi:hypothetical protein